MARRRSSGVVAAWAEAQRRQQRQREQQQRALVAQQREFERAERAAVRAAARDQREALLLYQQECEDHAAAQTREIEAQVAELTQILRGVLTARPFKLDLLKRQAEIPPFNPGPLGVPVPMPDQLQYQVPPPAGLRSLSPAARREYQSACEYAQAQFEYARQRATEAEHQRQRQLAEYQRQCQEWADGERQRIAGYNAQIDELGVRLARGEPEAIQEYFAGVLYAPTGWPENFPRRLRVAWDGPGRQLVVDWELPGLDVVPAVSRYRYIKSDDRQTQIPRPAGERKVLYRQILAQCALRVLAEIFRSDHGEVPTSATVNGFVTGPDPATGQPGEVYLLTVMAGRADFARLDLGRVDPASCFEGLKGQLSPRPEKLVPVHPIRLASTMDADSPGETVETAANLMDMDPLDFEDLVAALFAARGYQVMTTERTGDGGVDVRAMDPDPIGGGRLVIQVKRYRHTIPPAPVRDLYGTVLHEGATKGILVSTAEFGPGAQQFAAGKPLALIGGSQLADLLSRHGVSGRVPAPRGRHAAPADDGVAT